MDYLQDITTKYINTCNYIAKYSQAIFKQQYGLHIFSIKNAPHQKFMATALFSIGQGKLHSSFWNTLYM